MPKKRPIDIRLRDAEEMLDKLRLEKNIEELKKKRDSASRRRKRR